MPVASERAAAGAEAGAHPPGRRSARAGADEGGKGVAGRWRRRLAAVQTPVRIIPPERIEVGMRAQRPRALAFALLLFVAGFSLDDLRVLRLPGYLVGAVGALAVAALGPLWMGRRFALDHLEEAWPAFKGRAARSGRLGALLLLAAGALLAVWLVFFSAGVPPWAR